MPAVPAPRAVPLGRIAAASWLVVVCFGFLRLADLVTWPWAARVGTLLFVTTLAPVVLARGTAGQRLLLRVAPLVTLAGLAISVVARIAG